MLDDSPAQDDHAGVDAEHSKPIDPSEIVQNVDYLHIKMTSMSMFSTPITENSHNPAKEFLEIKIN